MKERPILMSAPMVRASLSGRKTNTRRIFTIPSWSDSDYMPPLLYPGLDGYHMVAEPSRCLAPVPCPYGKPGDRLWVRETWRPYSWPPHHITVQMRADGEIVDVDVPDTVKGDHWTESICESANLECQRAECDFDGENYSWDGDDNCPIKWRPSIFMPRWVSRLTLEITQERIERLQDISEQGCIAEGIESDGDGHYANYLDPADDKLVGCWMGPKPSFASLWDSINGVGSWAANPLIRALAFKVIHPAIESSTPFPALASSKRFK